MPAAFAAFAPLTPMPAPAPATLHVLLLRAVSRVLREPALEPHLEALLGQGDRDDRAHLAWVIRAPVMKLVEWAEAVEAEDEARRQLTAE